MYNEIEMIALEEPKALDDYIEKSLQGSSEESVRFRRWATKVLKEYIIKGFALDDQRLKGEDEFGARYFYEMAERLREIRLSLRNSAQKITDVYAECCCDYDAKAAYTHNFYMLMFNMMNDPSIAIIESNVLEMAEKHAKSHQLLSVHEIEQCCL